MARAVEMPQHGSEPPADAMAGGAIEEAAKRGGDFFEHGGFPSSGAVGCGLRDGWRARGGLGPALAGVFLDEDFDDGEIRGEGLGALRGHLVEFGEHLPADLVALLRGQVRLVFFEGFGQVAGVAVPHFLDLRGGEPGQVADFQRDGLLGTVLESGEILEGLLFIRIAVSGTRKAGNSRHGPAD